jgi:hypothetical protein
MLLITYWNCDVIKRIRWTGAFKRERERERETRNTKKIFVGKP